jgi:flagellar FliL protein
MADEEKEASSGGGAAGGGSSGGPGKLGLIIAGVQLLLTLGIIAVLVMGFQKEKSKPTVEDIVKGQAAGGAHGDAKGEGKGEGKPAAHGEGGGHGDSLTDSGKIIPLDQFTVNLSSGIGTFPRYIRINVSVELEQNVPDKEFDIKLPRVRDTIINLLNSKKVSDISSVDGRELLKEEIKKSVNGFMLQSKVRSVYFTNFAISNP